MTTRAEGSRGALLAPRGDNVRFGAAVYGSLLVASVIGVAFETAADASKSLPTAAAQLVST